MYQKPATCPQCGKQTLFHNHGVSGKTGKPYENFKCSNKDCNYIKWVDENQADKTATAPIMKPEITPPNTPNNFDKIMKELREIKEGINILMEKLS